MPAPYEISRDATAKPFFSGMSMAEGPKDVDWSLVGFIDAEQGTALDIDTLGDMSLYGTYLRPEEDCWDHITMECLEDEDLAKLIKEAPEQTDPGDPGADPGDAGDPGVDPEDPPAADPLKRQVVIVLYAAEAGDFTWHLDDLGMSLQTLDSKKLDDTFGKYDFMSGTSMAAPFVSGAIAQKAAELKLKGSQVDPETLVNETVSLAKEAPVLKVIQKGSFDFTKRPEQLGPRIGKVTVDTAKKTITIKGSGLDPQGADLKVEVGDDAEDEQTLQEAEIVSKSDRAVTIKDKGWINNIKTIRVTGFDGKQNTREDVYLVRGKKKFTKIDGSSVSFGNSNTTDGKYVYVADSYNKMIRQINPNNLSDENTETFFLNPKQIFKIKNANTARYTMLFGTDMAYIDGKLYNVMEYGQYDTPDPEEDYFIIFSGSSYATDEEEPDDSDSFESGGGSIYSGELRLVSVDTKHEGKAVNLGTLPASLENTADWTMATYNGKLYFMGGYCYGKDGKGFTKNVHIYDPKTKKWSKGPALKEARAGGKALQVGSKLIYTMGYAPGQTGVDVLDQKYPANLIFDGKQWTVSKKAQAIEPAVIGETVKRGGNEYITSPGSISLTKNGIVYTGVPAVNYGDTFVYDIGKDAFADSGYNFAQDISDTQPSSVAVGGTLFGTSDDTLYKMPIANGLVKVTTAKAKGGSVKGTGSYMPGSKATIKVTAAKFYEIKSLKQGKKTIKLGKNKRIRSFTIDPLTADQKITAKFQKYKVKVTVKKKGKGKVTGAKKYTAGATATIKVKAAKGYVIKSIRVGKKAVKVKKNARSRTFKIKKMAKNYKVTVVFKKAK